MSKTKVFQATVVQRMSKVKATVFQAMGIDHRSSLTDRQGRPFQICDGEPLPLLG